MPSQPLQAKARNDGLFWTVLVLLVVFTLALWVEVQGRVWQDQFSYERYMTKRSHAIEITHWLWHQTGGYVQVIWSGHETWCGPVAK